MKRGRSLGILPETKRAEARPAPRHPKEPGAPVKASFFMKEKTHDQLIEICHKYKISQQQVFAAALSAWFQAMGEKTIDELEGCE